MATKCFPIVRGKRMRVTRLDECGNPPEGATPSSLVVTEGFVSVALTSETESGDDIILKNANGDLVVNDKSQDQFKRWNLAASFAEVDPALLEMMSNAVLEQDYAGDVVGIRGYEGSNPDAFALEVWAGVPGSDCVPGEDTNYGYLLLPFVVPGVLGDVTIENGAATFSIGGYTRGAGGWGIGPYDVVPTDAENTPGQLTVAMASNEHHLLRLTTVAPPEAACGAVAMPSWTQGGEGE
jgi:hypothetical protein